MRIGRHRDAGTASPLRRRSPPDYTQRSTKLKLFAMVAALMVVLAFAERARDPRTWQWLWGFEKTAANSEPKLDNRLQPKPLRTANGPEGTFIAVSEEKSAADTSEKNRLAIDPVQRAWEQGWKDVYDRLDADRQTLLFQMLYCGTRHVVLPSEKRGAAGELLGTITRLWEDYQATAFQSVAQLTGDDQALWVDVLRQVNGRFSEQVRPALQGVTEGRTLAEAEEAALNGLRQTLLAQALDRIEDDTVFRPVELQIWFYELGRVRDEPAEALQKESVGDVSYLQLFNQTGDYRGKVVTISGSVEGAYRLRAPDNYLGIKQYYVYWIHPSGGPPSPIIVYALAAPPGFPTIKDRDTDGGITKLREPVRVTGVLFKRYAYVAQDGSDTYSAPMILANVPEWTPPPKLMPADNQLPLTPGNVVAVIGGTLILALIVGLVFYRLSGRRRRSVEAYGPSADMSALRNVTMNPTADESLRDMERQANRGKLEP